jgi:dihydrodipicolinate synthase/N-acetylneuraminate lyase
VPSSDDEVRSAIDRMAREAAPPPLVLYNPPDAKTRLTTAQFGHLVAEFPQLIGIKVAGGDAAWLAATAAAARHAPAPFRACAYDHPTRQPVVDSFSPDRS